MRLYLGMYKILFQCISDYKILEYVVLMLASSEFSLVLSVLPPRAQIYVYATQTLLAVTETLEDP